MSASKYRSSRSSASALAYLHGHLVLLRGLVQEQGGGRRASVLALTPETLIANRDLEVSLLPHFGTWMRLRELEEDPETLGELMGMPCLL